MIANARMHQGMESTSILSICLKTFGIASKSGPGELTYLFAFDFLKHALGCQGYCSHTLITCDWSLVVLDLIWSERRLLFSLSALRTHYQSAAFLNASPLKEGRLWDPESVNSWLTFYISAEVFTDVEFTPMSIDSCHTSPSVADQLTSIRSYPMTIAHSVRSALV